MGTEPDTEPLALGEYAGTVGTGILHVGLGRPGAYDRRHGRLGAVPFGGNRPHAVDHAGLCGSHAVPVPDLSTGGHYLSHHRHRVLHPPDPVRDPERPAAGQRLPGVPGVLLSLRRSHAPGRETGGSLLQAGDPEPPVCPVLAAPALFGLPGHSPGRRAAGAPGPSVSLDGLPERV